MNTQEHEIALVKKALAKESAELFDYLNPHLVTLVHKFVSDPKIAALEIPEQSLMKAAEQHFDQAVARYGALIEAKEKDPAKELPPFIPFYAWFAEQGMTEYALHWQTILMQGGCADCGTHSH